MAENINVEVQDALTVGIDLGDSVQIIKPDSGVRDTGWYDVTSLFQSSTSRPVGHNSGKVLIRRVGDTVQLWVDNVQPSVAYSKIYTSAPDLVAYIEAEKVVRGSYTYYPEVMEQPLYQDTSKRIYARWYIARNEKGEKYPELTITFSAASASNGFTQWRTTTPFPENPLGIKTTRT